jgi:2-dehydropantoate 2-reductase
MASDSVKQTYEIGELDGRITPRIKEVKAILDKAGSAGISGNLLGERWTKLAVNASFSGMSAALGCTYGDILDDDKALLCAAFVKDELIKVAHAQGIKLVKLQDVLFEDFELINGQTDFPSKKPLYINWYTPHRKVIASMLFDIRLGRKCEIEAINGEVAAKGDELEIDTPFNDKVVELVKEAEDNKAEPDFVTNLRLFTIP